MKIAPEKEVSIKRTLGTGVVEESPIVSYCSQGEPYSYYKDDTWVFFEQNSEVKFNCLDGDFKESVKLAMYNSLKCEKRIYSKSTYNTVWIRGARCFQKIIQSLGGDSFDFIDSDEGLRSVINEGIKLETKFTTWTNHLIIFSKLYEQGLIERKFDKPDEIAKELSSLSGISQQSVAIPEKIAAQYINFSMNVINRYHPYRYSISNAYKQFIEKYNEIESNYQTTCVPRAIAQKLTTHDIPYDDFQLDLRGAWLSWIRGACYTLIASFTGCRDGEIKSFNLDSYSEEKYGDFLISIVTGLHTKPNMGGVERRTSWVTIEATKKAIELLWYSFEFARDIWSIKADDIEHVDERRMYLKGVNSLFINLPYTTATKPAAGRQSISRSLGTLSKSVGYKATIFDVEEFNLLNPTRKGELMPGEILIPHPHGFRRTFAVFLVRNKLGSMLDLKYQFKHINIAMTIWYSNQANVAGYFDMTMDDELMNLIAEENHEFMTDTLYYIYNDASSLSGREGDRIMQEREKSTAAIYISREAISQQLNDGQLSITEHPFGHCTNPACSRICDMQTCKYKVITKEKALSLLPERDRLVDKFKALKTWGVRQPNITSKIYFDIRSIDRSLADHNIEFIPFNDDLSFIVPIERADG